MKKTLLAGVAALFLATGAAHADISSESIPKSVVILWVKEATTKNFVWEPDSIYKTMQECLDQKRKFEENPAKNVDAKGFTRPLKCIRYN
jgi:hypothetical protein